MRVFLDTNVLVSALATRVLCAELFEVVLQSHDLLTSESVLVELERVLPRIIGPSDELIRAFTSLLQDYACLITAEVQPLSLPDPDDEPIVASALAGQASVFVTGDKALLKLKRVEKLPIVSPREFWEMLAGRKAK